MDHRPYEEWLLNDSILAQDQDRDLRVHLRNCPQCAALARANLALRAAPVIAPASGFTLRFQARLAAQRKVQMRRSILGLSLLALASVSGLLWVLLPYLPFLSMPPGQLAVVWISNLVYLALMARALTALGNILLNVAASLIPSYVWASSLLLLGGLGFLWTFSFRKVTKMLQSES